jgi:hypothetical protein
MIKLSVTSKLDGIKSWSLQALDTCPGSKNADGTLVAACSGCYATTGNYRFPNVIKIRANNFAEWQAPSWESDMISALENERYFRWFDSGDMYNLKLAKKIYNIMKNTPWVKHWLPTRMAKFPKFQTIINEMKSLDNVSVRFSSDSITGEYDETHGSVIIQHAEDADNKMSVCHAYTPENAGKCNGCRACWDKSVELIAYVAHGKKIGKVYKTFELKAA